MFPLLPLIICAIVAFISDFWAIWKIFWATWKVFWATWKVFWAAWKVFWANWKVFWAAWKVLSNLWNIFEQPQKDFWPTRKDFWVAQKTWKGSDLFPSAHSGRRLPPSIKVGCTQINAKRCISPKSPSPKVFPFLFQFSSITYSQYFFKYTWMKKHKWISGSICVSMQYQSSMCLEKFCQSTNGTLYHLECNFITTITYRVGLTLSLRTFVENRISGTGAMGRLLRLGLVAIFHFYGRWKIILTAAWLLADHAPPDCV